MKTEQPENKKKRGIFQICCLCCFRKPHVKSDEIMFNSFGDEFTEYEYVIENLAIRRAPKILLDSYRPPKRHPKFGQTEMSSIKNFSSPVTRKFPPAISRGPVIEAVDVGLQEDIHANEANSSRDENKRKNSSQFNPNWPGYDPCFKRTSYEKRDSKPCKMLFPNESSILENSAKGALPTMDVFRVDELSKLKISADVHKPSDTDSMQMNIPLDLQETIEALKIAKPPASPGFRPKNHRTISKSESSTSCDKEVDCNLIEYPSDIHEKPTPLSSPRRAKNKVHRMIVERDRSLEQKESTSIFPTDRKLDQQNDSSNEIEDQDATQNITIENAVPRFEKSKGQSLKWKIIINKHKDS